MYDMYIGSALMPVMPPSIDMKINNDNRTLIIVNKGEVVLPKLPKLTDISFELLLPNQVYPWARYVDGFHPAEYYLKKFEYLKVKKRNFQFIVSREMPSGKKLFATNMKCVLEDYTIKEDAENGFDVVVSLNLKQYKPLEIQTCSIKEVGGSKAVKTTSERDGKTTNTTNKTHTVIKGETLTSIAKKYYGDSSLYKKIYNANPKIFTGKSANDIKAGDVLTITPA